MSEFIPNSYQTPNAYVDRLMPLLTDSEWRVLSYMARRIFGFNKRQDTIAVSQMESGVTGANGQPLDYGTGLGRKAIIRAVQELQRFGVVLLIAPNDPGKNEGACYALQLDSACIAWAELQQRQQDQRAKGRRQTASAREAPRKQERGVLDTPGGRVVEHTGGRVVEHTDNIQSETQTEKHRFNGVPADAGSPTSRTPVQAPLAETTKPKRPPDLFFEKLCEIVGIDWRTCTKEKQGEANQACGILRRNGYTTEDLQRFWTDVWLKDYRWTKNRSRPTLTQVRNEIQKIRAAGTMPDLSHILAPAQESRR